MESVQKVWRILFWQEYHKAEMYFVIITQANVEEEQEN